MLDELMILARIKEGDIKAFEGIFRRYYSLFAGMLRASRVIRRLPREIVESCSTCCGRTGAVTSIPVREKLSLPFCENEAVQFCEHQEVKERYRASVRTESGPGYSSDPAHLEYEELRTPHPAYARQTAWRRQQIFRMHRMEGRNMQRLPVAFRCPSRRWKRK